MLTEYSGVDYAMLQLLLGELAIPAEAVTASLRQALLRTAQALTAELARTATVLSEHRRMFVLTEETLFDAMRCLSEVRGLCIPALRLCDERERDSDSEDDESFRSEDCEEESNEDEDEDFSDSESDGSEEEDEFDVDALDFPDDNDNEKDDSEEREGEGDGEEQGEYASLSAQEKVCADFFLQAMREQGVHSADTLRERHELRCLRAFLLHELRLSLYNDPSSLCTRLGCAPLALSLAAPTQPPQQQQLQKLTESLATQSELLSQEQLQSHGLIRTLQDLISALRETERFTQVSLSLRSPVAKKTFSAEQEDELCRTADAMQSSSSSRRDPLNGALQGVASQLKSAEERVLSLQAQLETERREKRALLRKDAKLRGLISALQTASEESTSSPLSLSLSSGSDNKENIFGGAFRSVKKRRDETEITSHPYPQLEQEEADAGTTEAFVERLTGSSSSGFRPIVVVASSSELSAKKRKLNLPVEDQPQYLYPLEEPLAPSTGTPSLFAKSSAPR